MEVRDGVFEDSFAPYAVHLYELPFGVDAIGSPAQESISWPRWQRRGAALTVGRGEDRRAEEATPGGSGAIRLHPDFYLVNDDLPGSLRSPSVSEMPGRLPPSAGTPPVLVSVGAWEPAVGRCGQRAGV